MPPGLTSFSESSKFQCLEDFARRPVFLSLPSLIYSRGLAEDSDICLPWTSVSAGPSPRSWPAPQTPRESDSFSTWEAFLWTRLLNLSADKTTFTTVTETQNFPSVSETTPLLPDIQRGDQSYRFRFPICAFLSDAPAIDPVVRPFLGMCWQMSATASFVFLVSLSFSPTAVNLSDSWSWTSNPR